MLNEQRWHHNAAPPPPLKPHVATRVTFMRTSDDDIRVLKDLHWPLTLALARTVPLS